MKKIIIFLFVLNVFNAQAQNDLFVSSGVTFKIDGMTTVTLADTKLTNNGTVEATAGSTLLVKGTATTANSSIVGTGTTTLAHLTIDKSSNDAQIDQNLSVSGDLTMTSGNLKLNAGNITFTGSGQIVGETNTKRIYGTGGELITTLALNAPTNVNPANLGANITSTANLGNTTIKRGHSVYTVAGSSIARYYDINPTTNTGLNATLKFYYQDGEINGSSTEANLKLWRSTNTGTSWTDRGKDAINTTDNFITLGSIAAFSRWTADETPTCNCDPSCSPIATLAGTYTATRSVTIGNMTHHCFGNQLLLSTKLASASTTVIAPEAVKVKIEPTVNTYTKWCGATTSAAGCFFSKSDGNALISRFGHIDATAVTGGAITTANFLQVVSYFSNADFLAMNTALTTAGGVEAPSIASLRVYQPKIGDFGIFPNPTTTGSVLNMNRYSIGTAATTFTWKHTTPQSNINAVEFQITNITNGFGIGKY